MKRTSVRRGGGAAGRTCRQRRTAGLHENRGGFGLYGWNSYICDRTASAPTRASARRLGLQERKRLMKISEIFTYLRTRSSARHHEWRNPVIRWLVQPIPAAVPIRRGPARHGTIVRSAASRLHADVAGTDRRGGLRRRQGLGWPTGWWKTSTPLPQNPRSWTTSSFAERRSPVHRRRSHRGAGHALLGCDRSGSIEAPSTTSGVGSISQPHRQYRLHRRGIDRAGAVAEVPLKFAQQCWASTAFGISPCSLASMVIIWVIFTILYIIPNTKVNSGGAS